MLQALSAGPTANKLGSKNVLKVAARRNDCQKQATLSSSTSGKLEKATLSSDRLSVSTPLASEAIDVAINEA